MADSDFKSGISGKVFVGTTDKELAITRWSIDNNAESVDYRNSKTSRFDVVETTFLGVTGEIGIDRDFGNDIFGTDPAIVAGVTLKDLRLQETEDEDLAYVFAEAKVIGVPHELLIDGKITLMVRFRNSGPYLYPNGVDPVAAIEASEA